MKTRAQNIYVWVFAPTGLLRGSAKKFMSCFCVRDFREFHRMAFAAVFFSVSPIKGSTDFCHRFRKNPKLLAKPTSNNCFGGPQKWPLFHHFFDQKWVLPVTEELQKWIIAWGEVIWDVFDSKSQVTWLTCVERWAGRPLRGHHALRV